MDLFDQLIKLKKEQIPCVMITCTDKEGEGPATVGKKMLVTKEEAFGTIGGGGLEYHAREYCKKILQSKTSKQITYLLDQGKVVDGTKTLPMVCGGKITLFYEFIGFRNHVYIFGAGHVGKALSEILEGLHFNVTVIDHRKEVMDDITKANQVHLGNFVAYVEEGNILDDSMIVVTTPSHRFDYDILDKIFEMKIPFTYLGMICSKEKLKGYLERVQSKFGDVDLSNFYSPIGINTGGGSPKEIAIGVASELLAVSYGKKEMKHMREKNDIIYWK